MNSRDFVEVNSTNSSSSARNMIQVMKTLQLVKSAARHRRNIELSESGGKVMYPRKNIELPRDPVRGGKLITEDLAVELRQIVFGSSVAPPRGEWLRTGFSFRDPDQEFSFGLKGPRNSTRGLLSVVQAHIIKYFLFEKKKTELLSPDQLLKPSKCRQIEALWTALANIIWTSGEKKKCSVCLPCETPALQHSSIYFADGVTEFIHIFDFSTVEDLRAFLKRYIYLFLKDPGFGALLLLYSTILTRGTSKVKGDIENEKALVFCEEEGSSCIITLLLTGRATPYLHNGVVYVGDEDHYALPQWGIMSRSDIGYLVHYDVKGSKNLEESKHPGSRLKTPSFPVWVINYSGHYGVIFNTNSELLRNYHAEKRFDLHFCSVGGNYLTLSVDTRYNESASDTKDNEKRDDNNTCISSSPIEKLIHTKWQDAHITYNEVTPMNLLFG